MNTCVFSDDRKYRYRLTHQWDELVGGKRRTVMWIGLNPSTADERKLDPTLRRIRRFSDEWGFNQFVMTNLFAFRATDPWVMKQQCDPVGDLNDTTLIEAAQTSLTVIACWGAHGSWLHRDEWVFALMRARSIPLYCLGLNADGSPKHPLYVKADTKPQLFRPAPGKVVAS